MAKSKKAERKQLGFLFFFCHLCHFVTLVLAENYHFGRKYCKNGFGKAFAVEKGKAKIDKNNKQIKNYNYGKDYWY